MYNNPYSNSINYDYKKQVEELQNKIEEEKKKPNVDTYKIIKMKEQQYMSELFSDNIYGNYNRFRSPW